MSIAFLFDERKATQAATYLLSLNEGKMNYMKMIKLLYLSDKKAILSWYDTITTDYYMSLDEGPVVHNILKCIKDGYGDNGSFWSCCIRTKDYDVELVKDIETIKTDELSKKELSTLRETNEEFAKYGEWDMIKYCHTLPEWQDPAGSSIPITIESILSSNLSNEDSLYDDAYSELMMAAEIQKQNYRIENGRKL